MNRKLGTIFSILFIFSGISFGESLEDRVKALEEKVKQLEQKINQLESKTIQIQSEAKNIPQTKIPASIKPPKPVDFVVLSKKFKEAERGELLWNRDDKIELKVQFVSRLKKNASNIIGKMLLIDKKTGKVLMETPVNINKALNIFKGTEIKPGEKLTYRVDFLYDKRKPEHRLARDLPLEQLEVKFKPIEVVYSDGTVIYYEH
ncbi:MAG: hypothetical protein DSY53_00455 [Persephonella sp.]|nr:MAG: hypothetical protein DSY53_00455 [Persephonella sp.]